jgi:BirA family biotin operon repressor/biotin-[acetyl-CoA-carboxylase] ligase
MKVIKLNATPSTNDYLKDLINQQIVENFTVVTTDNQTNGRGQMGAKWESETGKNLTMSVLVKDLLLDIDQIYSLNVAVAVSVIQALESYKIPQLSIKWPNDIMSANFKIGGILIENSIKSSGEIFSIVGIGINVNQENFESLPKASSLRNVSGQLYNKDELMMVIVEFIRKNYNALVNKNTTLIWEKYRNTLFKRYLPMLFESNFGNKFMGIIQNVSTDGKLEILLENDSIQQFEVKSVTMLY